MLIHRANAVLCEERDYKVLESERSHLKLGVGK